MPNTISLLGWVVEYLVRVRGGDLSQVGYVPTGFSAGLLLGRMILPEPTHRFGDKRMLLLYFVAACGFQLIVWLVPNIIADATALGVMGFFLGPFFPTVSLFLSNEVVFQAKVLMIMW